MYSFINEDHKGNKSAKGINRDVNKMNHKEHIYKFFEKKLMSHEMERIQSRSVSSD